MIMSSGIGLVVAFTGWNTSTLLHVLSCAIMSCVSLIVGLLKLSRVFLIGFITLFLTFFGNLSSNSFSSL